MPKRDFPGCAALLALLLLVTLDGAASRGRAATLACGDGVNLQPSYYHDGDVNFGWDLMARQTRIRALRIEIEPTIPVATAKRWVMAAQAHGYRVIATYHRSAANGSDRMEELINAAKWWRAHYAELSAGGPLTVNLMNEWGSHAQTPESYAAAYNAALPIVREAYRGPVIVDLPGWGQEVHVARAAGGLIRDDNIVFSVHIYASAWVQHGAKHWMNQADLDALGGCGRPVIVGEFSGQRKGGADWSALVDHSREKGWTLFAWAWNGDGEGMNMTAPFWGTQPLPPALTTSRYFDKLYQKLRAGKSTAEGPAGAPGRGADGPRP